MNWNRHSDLEGSHAFLSASKYHWINYDADKLADSYKMELDKVKELLPVESLKGDLQVRKAAKLIAESAVAVAPKAEEKAE